MSFLYVHNSSFRVMSYFVREIHPVQWDRNYPQNNSSTEEDIDTFDKAAKIKSITLFSMPSLITRHKPDLLLYMEACLAFSKLVFGGIFGNGRPSVL